MRTPLTRPKTHDSSPALTLSQKIWREFKRLRHKKPSRHANGLHAFDPRQCSVEPAGLELLRALVRESAAYAGPIVEVGTLLGVTATQMALVKQPEQKIITVDNYCWNPWNLPADQQHALAQLVLSYLIGTGHVQQVRMSKEDFYSSYHGPSPALVFLDAWHTYEETKKDIQWALRVGARLIAGHDYGDLFPGVVQAVEEFGGLCQLSGSVWVLADSASGVCSRAA